MNETAAAQARWQRLRGLFDAALDVAGDERDAWLARECADDPSLLAEVRALLVARTHSDDALADGNAHAARRLLATDDEPADDARVGTRMGAYRLLRLLGRGGMGSVYLAERADGQFRQQVALKLIDDERPARELRERFLRERDILARLAHPNIAQLHEGGVSDDGLPYFTLELVDGEPLTHWCDAHRLGVRARVGILLKVCDAVQYAHRNLIVHRDLKPSNILVNAAGEPKLLDFGIAKFLDDDAIGAQTTDAHARPMTREYAAPEQVLAQPITTVTDVYALGVLLYELRTGRLPYAQAERGAISWAKAIVEETPEPLARALARTRKNPAAVAGRADATAPASAYHHAPSAARKRELLGDPDAIVQRALQKAPEARYASVAAFADALRAYLDGRAQPGERWSHRLRKFVHRHALAAGFVAAVVLIALTALAGVLWEARQTAVAGRRAQAIQQFLTSVFDVSDPDRAQGQTITARELLDEGAHRAQTELADQPQLQADLLRLIGTLYFRLGLYARAEPLQTQAVALLEALDPHGEAFARALGERAESERLQERFADAERDLDAALVLRPARGATAVHADLVSALGTLYADTARNENAERMFREALEIDRIQHASPDERLAADEERLARALASRARYDEARGLLADALGQQRRLHGERHSAIALTLEELGKLELSVGNLADADTDFDAALAMRRALFGSQHPSVADSLYWVGSLRSYQGRYAEAEAIADEALAIDRAAFGEESAHTAPLHDLLAEVAQAGNDLDRAEREARTALATWERVLGGNHSEIANGLQRLALILRDRGNADEAVELLRRAVAIRRATLGPSGERIGFTLANLGETLRIAGRRAEAVDSFGQALAIYSDSLPAEHVRVVEALDGLGHTQLDDGAVDTAIATLERAWTMAQRVYPATHPDRVRTLLPLGEAYLAHAEADRAAGVLAEAKRVLGGVPAAHVRNRIQVELALGRARTAQQQFAQAREELDAAAALLAAHAQATESLAVRYRDARHELDDALKRSLHASR